MASILSAFEAAEKINATLWHKGLDSQYLSVDELHRHVEETFRVKIEFRLVDIETKHVYGFIERYDDGSATVYIVKNIPVRWKRLVGVKELCQVVIDTAGDMSTDGLDTLQRLFGTVTVDINAPENAALRSELLAEIAAWELVYPHERRHADLAKIQSGETTIALLAAHFRIPETIVAQILNPTYLRMCDKYWAEVFEKQQRRVVANFP